MVKKFLFFSFLLISSLVSFSENDSLRHFNAESIEKYTEDKGFDYSRKVVVEKNSLIEFLGNLLDAIGRFLGSTAGIIFLILLLIAAILYGFRDSIFKKKAKEEEQGDFLNANLNNTTEEEENLLEQFKIAEKKEDYKTAIRFLFVLVIKSLAEQKKIKLHKEKTNSQYRKELPIKLQPNFKRLALIFDYTWYGEYNATESTLNSAKQLAQTLKNSTHVA